MTNVVHPADERRKRPTLSIVLVIAFQAILGVLILLLVVRAMRVEYFSGQAYPDPGVPRLLGSMLALAILWIANAIGLCMLLNWSRWLSLILASAGVLGGSLGVMLYQRQPGFDFTPLLFELLLSVSVVVSVWWWIVFTRKAVRAQFR